jgi:TRAP transporter TAXI family solute receptor
VPERRNKKQTGVGVSAGKAIAVLRAFVDGQNTWGVRELANALGQPGSSVHRLLQILRKEGLIEWDPEGQKYRTGMELFRWSAILNRRFKLAEVARPIMMELSARFDESCWLGVYDQTQHSHAYVSEVTSSRPFNYAAPLAQYKPLEASAAGMVVLAFLPAQRHENIALGGKKRTTKIEASAISAEVRRVRREGYAVRKSDDLDAPVTVAAPIFNARNNPVGSLTLAIPRHRCPPDKIREFGIAILAAANRLSRLIGSQVVGAAGTGTWHEGVSAIAALVHRDLPHIGSTIASRGGDGALRQLQIGQGGYCFAVADSLGAAYRGKPPFHRPHERLRAMFSLMPLHLHIAVRRDSEIRTFADLRRARISAGERDFTTAGVVIELLQLSGIAKNASTAERRLVFLDYPEAHREFSAGKLEAVIALTGAGDPSYLDLCRRSEVRFLALDRKLSSAFIARHPSYGRATIPAGVYSGSDAIQTVMVPTVMATTIDRGDDEVHAVIQAIFDHRHELSPILSGLDNVLPEQIFRGIDIPLHPAAERFWVERGLIEYSQVNS